MRTSSYKLQGVVDENIVISILSCNSFHSPISLSSIQFLYCQKKEAASDWMLILKILSFGQSLPFIITINDLRRHPKICDCE